MNGHAPSVDSPTCPCWWVIKGRQQGVLPPLTIIRERGIFLDRERIQRAWTPPGCGTPSPAPATRSTPAFPSSAKRWASLSAPGRLPPTTTMTMSDFSPFRRPSAGPFTSSTARIRSITRFCGFSCRNWTALCRPNPFNHAKRDS